MRQFEPSAIPFERVRPPEAAGFRLTSTAKIEQRVGLDHTPSDWSLNGGRPDRPIVVSVGDISRQFICRSVGKRVF
jgi:hypothetical protein